MCVRVPLCWSNVKNPHQIIKISSDNFILSAYKHALFSLGMRRWTGIKILFLYSDSETFSVYLKKLNNLPLVYNWFINLLTSVLFFAHFIKVLFLPKWHLSNHQWLLLYQTQRSILSPSFLESSLPYGTVKDSHLLASLHSNFLAVLHFPSFSSTPWTFLQFFISSFYSVAIGLKICAPELCSQKLPLITTLFLLDLI